MSVHIPFLQMYFWGSRKMTFAMLNALGSLLLVGIFFVVPALTQREPCTLKVFDESGEEVSHNNHFQLFTY